MNQTFAYIDQAFSATERTVRAASAVTVGVTTFLSKTVLPETARQTQIYKYTLGMFQRFVMEKVAQMEVETTDSTYPITDDYIPRKTVGTAVEMAGIFTVGFSPLWIFAILSDGAAGGRVYFDRLVDQLKADGLVAEDQTFERLDELFAAVQGATDSSAKAIDLPPLSTRDFSSFATDIRTTYGGLIEQSGTLMPQLDSLWAGMQRLAQRENLSLGRLADYMTMDALGRGAGMAWAAGKTGLELFDETILESYRQTLAEMNEQGIDGYFSQHMAPFWEKAREFYRDERVDQ